MVRSTQTTLLYVVIGSVSGAVLAWFVHSQIEAATKKKTTSKASNGRKMVRKMSKRAQLFNSQDANNTTGPYRSMSITKKADAPLVASSAQSPPNSPKTSEDRVTFTDQHIQNDDALNSRDRKKSVSDVASTYLIVQAAKEKWMSKSKSLVKRKSEARASEEASKQKDQDGEALDNVLSHLSDNRFVCFWRN